MSQFSSVFNSLRRRHLLQIYVSRNENGETETLKVDSRRSNIKGRRGACARMEFMPVNFSTGAPWGSLDAAEIAITCPLSSPPVCLHLQVGAVQASQSLSQSPEQ